MKFNKKKRKLSLNQFKTSTEQDQDCVLRRRKSESTNKSTKLWVDCLQDYLKEKGLQGLESITDLDLPKILEKCYMDVCTQKLIVDANGDPLLDSKGNIQYEEYSNNSLSSLRAGLARYFKLKLNIDIMDNPAFIQVNELFAGKLHINKQEGKGTTRHKEPISDQDLQTLKHYFETNMAGPPNATLLQEIVLFNIIFYMGLRGRENLRIMTKETFGIDRDGNGQCFIFQQKDETDKNHSENDTDMSNQARIYEVRGVYTTYLLIKIKISQYHCNRLI